MEKNMHTHTRARTHARTPCTSSQRALAHNLCVIVIIFDNFFSPVRKLYYLLIFLPLGIVFFRYPSHFRFIFFQLLISISIPLFLLSFPLLLILCGTRTGFNCRFFSTFDTILILIICFSVYFDSAHSIDRFLLNFQRIQRNTPLRNTHTDTSINYFVCIRTIDAK